jgi:hypothetical protein
MTLFELLCVLGIIVVINILLFFVLFLFPFDNQEDGLLVCEEVACGDLLSVFYQLCYKTCPQGLSCEDYTIMMLHDYDLSERRLSKDDFIERLQEAIADLKTKLNTSHDNHN